MKIEILKPFGFCSGVSKAINLALEIRQNNPLKNVLILGMLVHNDEALKDLNDRNIKTLYIKNKSLVEMIDEVKDDDIVILTAHGHSYDVEEKLKERNIIFYDATCPFVKNAMNIIKNAIDDEREVIYIGKENHPEANAALSLSNKIHLLNPNQNIDEINIINKKPFVISQTTFSKIEIENCEKKIKEKYPDAVVHNGVCNASELRQKALLNIKGEPDLIYVVGGNFSNNTKTLFEMAKNKYKNCKVCLIQNESDIKSDDLANCKNIFISSGASTPEHIVLKIKEKIEQLLSN